MNPEDRESHQAFLGLSGDKSCQAYRPECLMKMYDISFGPRNKGSPITPCHDPVLPAPSPLLASQPQAPLCDILTSISLASRTICLLAVFFKCATRPTPQLSFSSELSYRPLFGGNLVKDVFGREATVGMRPNLWVVHLRWLLFNREIPLNMLKFWLQLC